MFTETIGNSHAGRKVISRQYLLSLFIALVFALTMYPSKAQAQIVGDFEVQQAEANSTPAKSELIFNKYGNRYFLAKLFDEGNPSGSQVLKSTYEKKISQAAMEAQTHVPAHHRGQQGK